MSQLQDPKRKKQIEEIKHREELLKADVTKNPNDKDPLQKYIELNHKRATLLTCIPDIKPN